MFLKLTLILMPSSMTRPVSITMPCLTVAFALLITWTLSRLPGRQRRLEQRSQQGPFALCAALLEPVHKCKQGFACSVPHPQNAGLWRMHAGLHDTDTQAGDSVLSSAHSRGPARSMLPFCSQSTSASSASPAQAPYA